MRTVSRHFLRRTARDLERRLESAQKATQSEQLTAREARLLNTYGVKRYDRLQVESFVRGPFGWRIVAR